MFGKCKHKLGKVQEDGYQYCTECGKAFSAPKKVCDHVWEEENHMHVSTIYNVPGKHAYSIFIHRCTKCGIRTKNSTREDEQFYFPD